MTRATAAGEPPARRFPGSSSDTALASLEARGPNAPSAEARRSARPPQTRTSGGSRTRRETAWPNVADATRKAMRGNKSKNTKPELLVRRLVHAMGYRYRLHRDDLPGRPDLAFGPRKKAIFVHGCFWHNHMCRAVSHVPKTRPDYWREKFLRNARRDLNNMRALSHLGWQHLVVWECELSKTEDLVRKITAFLQ